MEHRMPGHSGQCDICEEPLGAAYWVHDHHLLVHTRCRPWEQLPWPFQRQLDLLQESWRKADPEGRERLEPVGVWLRSTKRRWPNDAREVAAALEERMAELGPLVRR